MPRIMVYSIVCYVVIILIQQSCLAALPVNDVIELIADRLQEKQIKTGLYAGCWPKEYDYTGSIVSGMAKAYDPNCNDAYKNSAELGGDSVFLISQGNFYGDEAYALTILSRNSADPNDNKWRKALVNFYGNVKNSEGGTESFIEYSSDDDRSIDVLYLAQYVLGAYYADANDKKIWRRGLISHLSYVDDTSFFPVMALGAALWALSETGPLDNNTPVQSAAGQGSPYWDSKKLSDLPELLMSHQVQDDQPNDVGSFYWQFTHTSESLCGYTEDAVFATLGLAGAYATNPDPNLYGAVIMARKALLNGVNPEGRVFEKLSREGTELYVYSGEMLGVLVELIFPGDIDRDGIVDKRDFDIIYSRWGEQDCGLSCWCNHADINRNGVVDILDLGIFCDNWLREAGY